MVAAQSKDACFDFGPVPIIPARASATRPEFDSKISEYLPGVARINVARSKNGLRLEAVLTKKSEGSDLSFHKQSIKFREL